jgi:hypothetical protein
MSNLLLDHYMDNLGAAQALGGIIPAYAEQIFCSSNTERIQDIVIQIDDCCIHANIERRTLWVPRELNTVANYMSKLCNGDAFKFSFTVQCPILGAYSPGLCIWPAYHKLVCIQGQCTGHTLSYNLLYFESEAEWLDASSCSCHWTWNPLSQEIYEKN